MLDNIELGSLDINEVNIRLGKLDIDTVQRLSEIYEDIRLGGNKCVLVEHFVSPNGDPVDGEIFDVRTMCYSLLAARQYQTDGRHDLIVPSLRADGFNDRIGQVVAGELLQVSEEKKVQLCGFPSVKYGGIPPFLRNKLATLLLGHFSTLGHNMSLEVCTRLDITHYGHNDVRPYWLRFRQVFEDAKMKLSETEFQAQLKLYP